MLYVKVLCDENFDSNLTYQIDGESIGKYDVNDCEKCSEYETCYGFKKEFDRCRSVKWETV